MNVKPELKQNVTRTVDNISSLERIRDDLQDEINEIQPKIIALQKKLEEQKNFYIRHHTKNIEEKPVNFVVEELNRTKPHFLNLSKDSSLSGWININLNDESEVNIGKSFTNETALFGAGYLYKHHHYF